MSEWGFVTKLVGNPEDLDAHVGFSQRLPNTDPDSLDTVQVNELAVLREQWKAGPLAIGLITEYLNRRYKHHWTTEQIVDRWRKLRHEYQEVESLPPNHVLLRWTGDYARSESDQEFIQNKNDFVKQTENQFWAEMMSEVERSSLSIDMDLERKAQANVTVITSVKEAFSQWARAEKWSAADVAMWGSGDQHFFPMPKGQLTTGQQAASGLYRVCTKRAFHAALHEWKLAVIEGEKPKSMPYPEDRKYKDMARAVIKKDYPHAWEDLIEKPKE